MPKRTRQEREVGRVVRRFERCIDRHYPDGLVGPCRRSFAHSTGLMLFTSILNTSRGFP